MQKRADARGTAMRGAVALCLFIGASGCAIPTNVARVNPDIARQMTPIAIDEGLKKLDDAETKRRIERMMASPEMRDAEAALIAGLVDGTLSTLSSEERTARIGALTTRYAREVVEGAMSGALDGALTEDRRRDMQRLAGSLVETSVAQLKRSLSEADLGPAVSSAVSDHLGPALQTVLKDNLGPGVAAMLESEDFQRALGKTAHVLGRETVLGAHEALAEIQRQTPEQQDGSLLTRVSHLAREGARLVDVIVWALAAVTLGLSIWVARLLVQRKRYLADTAQPAKVVPAYAIPPRATSHRGRRSVMRRRLLAAPRAVGHDNGQAHSTR